MTEVVSKVQGLAEVGEMLRGLPEKVREKIIRGAMRKAGNDLRDSVIEKTPVLSGDLKKSIKLVVGFSRRSETMVATVMDTQPAFYGRFVEMGTRHSKAQPFMRPAMESQADSAIETLRAALEAGIEKAAKS